MNDIQKQEYKQKWNKLIFERNQIIDELEKRLEREYYQKMDGCKRNIANDPLKPVLETKIKERKKIMLSNDPKTRDMDWIDNSYKELETISKDLEQKYDCNVKPMDLIAFEIGDQYDKNGFNIKIKQNLEKIKKTNVKPIMEDYKKKINELDQLYPKEESSIKWQPVMPRWN